MIIETHLITEAQQIALMDLWNSNYPDTLFHSSMESFHQYLNELAHKKYYLIFDQELVAAFALQFVRNEETWFAIIVDEKQQNKGWGKSLLTALQLNNTYLLGWVIDSTNYQRIDGRPYPSPLEFYIKNDFRIISNERLENEKLSAVKISWTKKAKI